MGKPAARITDMHICPMQTPGLPPIPHVGGLIIGPGGVNVLIGGLPAFFYRTDLTSLQLSSKVLIPVESKRYELFHQP